MPVYVYRTRDGSTFETEQRMAEDALVACPTTGQSVERVLQPFTPRYKGTGFYTTDHRTPSGNPQSPGPPGDGERSRRDTPAHEPVDQGGHLHPGDAGQPLAGRMLPGPAPG